MNNWNLPYDMRDIVRLLGLPEPRMSRSNERYHCPLCDKEGVKDKTLSVSFTKMGFNCFRCGTNGGMQKMYAVHKGLDRVEAKYEIIRALGKDADTVYERQHVELPVPQIVEEEPAPIEQRHEVYSAMLDFLPLNDSYRQALLARGFDCTVIEAAGYASIPDSHWRRVELVNWLIGKGYSLDGIPGFYVNKNGEWRFVQTGSGILIPVRDIEGRIQGMQVRLDKAIGGKYRWLSSGGHQLGTPAKAWVHIVGGLELDKPVLLTEGPLKADAIHHLKDCCSVVAIPGVNALCKLRPVLNKLRAGGHEKIYIAFDMDLHTNPNVRAALDRLETAITEHGLSSHVCHWDVNFKGLDDYLLAKVQYNNAV